jgi:hypothetical protein
VSVGLAGVIVGPRSRPACFGATTGDLANMTVKKYAYEAYPQWRASHPLETCPPTLLDLNRYMNSTNDVDPWGSHYRMFCGLNEHGKQRIVVQSFGEDALAYTADDIWSE